MKEVFVWLIIFRACRLSAARHVLRPPVNASTPPSRAAPHDSGPFRSEENFVGPHLPTPEWSATRKLWQKSRWVLVNAVTGEVDFQSPAPPHLR
jgi:hypothetical protein